MPTLREVQNFLEQNNLGRMTYYTGQDDRNYLDIPGYGLLVVDTPSLKEVDQSKIIQGGFKPYSSAKGAIIGGVEERGSPLPLSSFINQTKSQIEQSKVDANSLAINNAIKSGDVATVERLSPGMTLWNDAFVQKSLVPQLEAQGATVQNGNVVGSPLKTTQPLGQNTTSGTNSQLGANLSATGASTTNVPAYKDSTGRVFDAQGGYISWDVIPKGPDGRPLVNLDLLPVQDVSVTQNQLPTTEDITTNLKNYLSDETIAGMTPDNQAMFAAAIEAIKKQYEQDNPVPQTFTQADLDKIFTDAQNDPTINEYYKNQLRIGQETLGRTLGYLGAGYTAEQAATAMQQDQQRKQLAEQQAEAGRAISGFREKAKSQLGQEQSAVIESSKRQLEQQLNQLGSGFEQQYGSTNLPQMNIAGVSYNPIGGVTGNLEQQKLTDIRSLEQQNINKSALTRGLTT